MSPAVRCPHVTFGFTLQTGAALGVWALIRFELRPEIIQVHDEFKCHAEKRRPQDSRHWEGSTYRNKTRALSSENTRFIHVKKKEREREREREREKEKKRFYSDFLSEDLKNEMVKSECIISTDGLTVRFYCKSVKVINEFWVTWHDTLFLILTKVWNCLTMTDFKQT